jgi:DNA invertase Pin-like site-specific DNA recombinase
LADRITDGTHVAGEGNHEARLTWEQVRRIRQLAAAGKSRREIAAEFSLSKAHLRRIVVGESWREVAS